MTNIGFEKKLRGHKWVAVVFASVLLATLALVLALAAGPAKAACPPEGCPGGGDENSPPTLDPPSGSVTVSEGQTAAYAGTFSDPDGDAVTLSVTSGPGTVVQDPAGGDTGTWSWSFGTSDGPSQSQTVTITASDGQLDGDAQFDLTVNNAAPTATLKDPNPPSVNEGSAIPVSLINPSDPSPTDTAAGFSYSFSCQDVPNPIFGGTMPSWGSFVAENGRFCSTDDNGSRTVRARLRDKDGGISSYGRSVTIQNVAPTATFNSPLAVDEGSPINLSLSAIQEPSFADQQAGLQKTFKCGSSAATPTYGSFGASSSTACTTSDNGTFTVGAKIKDKDNGLTEYPLDNPGSVTVNNVAPTADLNVPASVNQRQSFTVLFTNQFDPSSADTSAGFTYAFDCGSGYGPTVTDSVASCAAGTGPSQTIKGKIFDKDGGVTERTRTVTINDITKPTVRSVMPLNNVTGVAPGTNVTATFSEAMMVSTISRSTFKLFKVNANGTTTQIANAPVTLSANGLRATLNPFGTSTTLLARNTKYKAMITTEAKDLAGNALDQKPNVSGSQSMVWSFTTR
jgi:hypothetical protein